MTEMIVTSSALILALLVLRRVFRQKISRRVQYALWGLVLVRLLAPVSLPEAGFSVLRAAAPAIREVENTALYIDPVKEGVYSAYWGYESYTTPVSQHRAALDAASTSGSRVVVTGDDVTHVIQYDRQIGVGELLRPIWYGGMAVMACWLVTTNFRFWRKLRRNRIPLELEGCPYPVYLVEEGLPSPCLFGLFRPAIYLTPAAMETEASLAHVLAHESTHARHLDPLWSLLRGVCLAIYWFDPLVWWAAAASRTDCELACDEGALRRLGADARLAYGQTLLRLIPVRRTGGSPLLTATTMTADKRRLADRVTRIAENRKMRKTALCAAAALAVLVCAVTFTGGGGRKRSLTAGELAWFNEYFFAGNRQESAAQWFLNIQYASPKQISPTVLFFNGGSSGGISSGEEEALRQAGMEGPSETEVLVKLSTADMNAVLRQYTGLDLEDMEEVGLAQGWMGLMDDLTYLPEYDAYYFTRYDYGQDFPGQVMRAGEREGDLVRLYYTDWDAPYEYWFCVTLEDRGDNEYWFVSNQSCGGNIPAVPTAYPSDPSLETIPLGRAKSYAPPDAQPVQRLEVTEILPTGSMMEHNISICATADGRRYLARYDEYKRPTQADCFAQLPDEGEISLNWFFNLFGCEQGLAVTYQVWLNGGSYGTQCTDYYVMDEDGNLTLLLRTYGKAVPIDLDGDGAYELAASDGWRNAQIFYQRGGALYCADLSQLLPQAWSEAGYLEFGQWDRTRRCLSLWGSVALPGQEDGSMGQATAFRDVYFDGKNLLVYKSNRAPAMDLPDYVNEAASAIAQDRMTWFQKNTGFTDGNGSPVGEIAEWDAWRLTRADKVGSACLGDLPDGLDVEVYDFAYELHTATPEKVILAGGTYVDEDGWVGGFYEEDRYLVFWRNPATGTFERLESEIASDGAPESACFRAGLLWTLVRGGVMELSDLSAEDLFDKLQDAPMNVLEDLASYPAAERVAALEKLMTHPKIAAYLTEMAGWDTSWFSDTALDTLERLQATPLG